MAENDTLRAARAYVARGLGVFPLTGKVPLTEHGVKDATTDLDLVELWFKNPRNIGIAIPDAYVIVDIDPRNGGDASFAEWIASYGDHHFDGVPKAHTGGGGTHFWFRLPAGVTRLKKNPAVGIDLLTVGRYVVAPPSETDAKYRWEPGALLPQDLTTLPELPGFIAQLARIEDREEYVPRPSSVQMVADGVDGLDIAAHRMTSWEMLLGRHGWKQVGEKKWRHPSSDNPFSATIKHDCLFVYSPNTQFPVTEPGDPHGITLFSALETLDYHGDRARCVQALRDAEYLDPLPEHGPGLEADYATAVNRVPVAPPKPAAAAKNGSSPPAPPASPEMLDDGFTPPRVGLSATEGINPKRARWVWDGRIPVGGLTLLAGREGEGKSTLAINFMADTTRGRLDGEFFGEPRDTVIIATEDSMEYTIVPRLLAAGADLKRVYFVEMIDPGDSLTLPVHLPDLELACAKHDVSLIVMDPLMSRLSSSLDSHKDGDVRRALEPLVSFTERIHAALLGLIHLNKSGSTDPLTAVMASKAFTAVARSVLFAMVDPENEERRLLGLVKSNLGRIDLPTLTYTFDPVKVGEDDGDIIATRILWGEPSETSIQVALERPREHTSKVEACAAWLEQYLVTQGGSALSSECIREGQKFSQNSESGKWGNEMFSRALRRFGGTISRAKFPSEPVYIHPGVSQ